MEVSTIQTRYSEYMACKIGANLSKKEILDLENADFQLPQHAIISPRRLFGMEELPLDLSSYSTPASPDDHPKTRS
jgi:hypothetical protein